MPVCTRSSILIVLISEQKAHLAELKDELDDIFYHGIRKVRQNFFGSHNLAFDPDGSWEGVKNITVEDCRAHWEKMVHSGNIVLSVVGDFDEAAVFENWNKLSRNSNRARFSGLVEC